MIALEISGDVEKAAKYVRRLDKRIIPKVTYRAVNRTMRKVNTATVREIAAHRKIKQKEIRAAMRQRFASLQIPNGFIFVDNRPITFRRYGAKPRGKGGRLGVVVKVTGQREYLTHAFQVQKLNNQFFERDPKTNELRVLHGPSFGSVLKLPASAAKLNALIATEFADQFVGYLKRELNRARARG